MGIFERMPHFPFPSPPSVEGPAPPSALLGLTGGGAGLLGFGTSKTWSVNLSDVHASIVPEGLKAREKMVAGSMPRRSSASLAQLLVAKIRTRVPCIAVRRILVDGATRRTVSLAVARSSPSWLSCIALTADEWAGIILTLPDSSETSWIWPVVRPGKASFLEDMQHRPQGLLAVSYDDKSNGVFANL